MSRRKSDNDERYVIDLCDHVLGITSKRQSRFDLLRGDPGKNGQCVRLPVDAYYETLGLVIEYREIQHFKPNTLMDRKQTCSGCTRGEQRKRYDQRRRDVLPTIGIRLIELDYHLFERNVRGRLTRNTARDETVVRAKLINYLNAEEKLTLRRNSLSG
jgi:hypothetical protein